MKSITTKDLRESLTLLIPYRHADGEGGWREEWNRGPTLWASLWPLCDKQERAHYRIIIRAGLDLPSKFGFLWLLRREVKRLSVINQPTLMQYNKFLCMTAMEVSHA